MATCDITLDLLDGNDQPITAGEVEISRVTGGNADAGFVFAVPRRVPVSNPPTVLGANGFAALEQSEDYRFKFGGRTVLKHVPALSSANFSDLADVIPAPPVGADWMDYVDSSHAAFGASIPTLEDLASTAVIPSDVSTTTTRAVYVAPNPRRLDQIAFSFSGAVAASDTNYWTVTLKRYRAGVSYSMAVKTTKATGGQAIGAYTEWSFDLVPLGNQYFAKGDVFAVTFTPTGSPAALGAPCVTFRPYPGNAPAPIVYAVTDDFARADGALGVAPTGQSWVVPSGTVTLVSGAAQTSAGAGTHIAYVESTISNCTVEAKIPTGSSTAGLLVRYSDASNYFRFTMGYAYKVVAGSAFGTVAGGTGYYSGGAFLAGDTMRIVMAGDSLKVYRQTGSVGAFTLAYDGVDSFNQTATKHGFTNRGTGADRFDDFAISLNV